MRTTDRMQPEDRPDFMSYDRATWRDWQGNTNKRYVVRPMKDGSGGFAVVDTDNNADFEVQAGFTTQAAALEYMRTNRAPQG